MHISLNQNFATMAPPQKAAVLAWANSHDWAGVKAHWNGDKLVCYFEEVTGDDDGAVVSEEFSTLRDLRDEAGY